MNIRYSLVIPCYNEMETLPALVTRLVAIFSSAEGTEIILVDNGSIDNSSVLLADATARYAFLRTVRVEVNQGYGWGILQGLSSARGDYLGWTHADMQTDPADAVKGFALLEELDAPLALVKGRRYGRPLADVFFSAGMGVFDSLLFCLPLWDINAQPTLFTRAFYERWRKPPHDFALDLFSYASAVKAKARIARFPVLFGKRQHGVSHWNVNWAAKWKFIKRTMDFSFALKKTWKKP